MEQQDSGRFSESGSVAVLDSPVEKDHWSGKVHTLLRKWSPDTIAFLGLDGEEAVLEAERRGLGPDEVMEQEGNILLNAGIQRALDLLIGAGGQALDNTHARIGVGDGTTAVTAADTDLSAVAGATHRYFMTMDASKPSRSGQTLTFVATFGSADGNFHWQEWGIDAGTAGGTTVTAPLLNRKVADWGTKVSGAVWQFTVTITLS